MPSPGKWIVVVLGLLVLGAALGQAIKFISHHAAPPAPPPLVISGSCTWQ